MSLLDDEKSRRPICLAYRQGRCSFGEKCFFRHVEESPIEVCATVPVYDTVNVNEG